MAPLGFMWADDGKIPYRPVFFEPAVASQPESLKRTKEAISQLQYLTFATRNSGELLLGYCFYISEIVCDWKGECLRWRAGLVGKGRENIYLRRPAEG